MCVANYAISVTMQGPSGIGTQPVRIRGSAFCHINADGVADTVTADVYYVGGKTYVLPVGSDANPIGGGYSNVSRSRNGQEAFNFDFPRTQGHHPGGSQSTIQARLEFNGLRGVAYDPEDGILSALQWRLDDNPDVIGINEWLVLPSASMGDHFLTLRATDAAGNSDETQIRITIAPVERLSFTRQTDSGAIILHWTSSSTLQSAPQITGPWADVPAAGNPYPVPFDSPLQFYRLQLRP